MSTYGNDKQTSLIPPSSRVVVVGAGISGLAAAWRLSRQAPVSR